MEDSAWASIGPFRSQTPGGLCTSWGREKELRVRPKEPCTEFWRPRVLLGPTDRSITQRCPALTSRQAARLEHRQLLYQQAPFSKPEDFPKGAGVRKSWVQERRPSIHLKLLFGHFFLGVVLVLLFNLIYKEKQKKSMTLVSDILSP